MLANQAEPKKVLPVKPSVEAGGQEVRLVQDRVETNFYVNRQRGIRVTNARVILQGKTYAMSNITAVELNKQPSTAWMGVCLAVIGIYFLVSPPEIDLISENHVLLGLPLFAIGMTWALLDKPTYHVRIGSASGEGNVLSDKDEIYIRSVVEAINDAMVERG